MKSKFTIPAPTDDSYLSTCLMQGQLPPLLERAMMVADQPAQQDMLLLSTLTVCSYALPHMKMLHGSPQHTYYPNLMTLVVAPPASGKGVMNNARLLLKPIQDKLRKQHKYAEIPANSSSAAFLDVLKVSDGQGFVMATEMDNLSKIWKKDYGDYSDLFRQAYEHETYNKARRTGMNKSTLHTFAEPKLSVLLSGTPNQLRPLIGSGEDGLASRFLPYILLDVMPFDRNALMNGDHYTDNGAKAVFEQLGEELCQRWEWLAAQEHDCLWSLTDEQAEALADFLEDWELLVHERPQYESENAMPELPDAFRAMFNRLPVTLKRIGLILSTLRLPINTPASCPDLAATPASNYKYTNLPQVLYCSDEDFKTLVILAEKLIRHLIDLALMLPEPKMELPINRLEPHVQPRAQEFLTLLPEKFTFADAVKIGAKNGLSRSTVYRYCNVLKNENTIAQYEHGIYVKVPK